MLYVNASEAHLPGKQVNVQNVKDLNWTRIQETLQRKMRSPVVPMSGQTGQYSRVYLVRHRGSYRLVKVTTRRDGEREASMLQYIRDAHPVKTPCGVYDASMYVPRLYSAGAVGDAYFLVIEYFKGQTLQEFMNGRASRTSPRSVMLMRRVRRNLQRAMRALLAIGVYHGDLHANNIMITPHGHVVILDFGFATRVPELKDHACTDASTIPSSVINQMRKQHYRYGRLMFHNNKEMYSTHLEKIDDAVRRMTGSARGGHPSVRPRITRQVSQTPSPFTSMQ